MEMPMSAAMQETKVKKSYVIAFIFSLLFFAVGIYQLVSTVNLLRTWSSQGPMEFVENRAIVVSKSFTYLGAFQQLQSPVSLSLIALVLSLILLSFLRKKTSVNRLSNAGVIILNIFVVLMACLSVLFVFLLFTPLSFFIISLGATVFDLIPGSSVIVRIAFLSAIILLLAGYTKGKLSSYPKKTYGAVIAGIAILIVVAIQAVGYMPSVLFGKTDTNVGGFVTASNSVAVSNFEANKDVKNCSVGMGDVIPCKYLLTKDDVTFELENNSSSALSYSPLVMAHIFPRGNDGRLSNSCPEVQISSINGESDFDTPIEGGQKYLVSFSCPGAMPASLEQFDIGTTMSNSPRYESSVYSSSIMILFPE